MRILITGAAGFIGSHVCEFYLNQGFNVIGIDNFDDYYSRNIKINNISNFINNANFEFHEINILNDHDLNEIFKKSSFDVIIHLAAKAGVRPSIDGIEEYYDVNLIGTISILQAMKKYGIKNLIFASSSSVYGSNKKIPFSESDSADHPIYPYGASKKSAELICHVYTHLHKLNITCLRFFTVYGPRQRPDLAIHKFTKLIDNGSPIPFYGDGNTSRDYTYIDDIISGINCSLKNLHGFNIYNLGNSHITNLKTLVETIENQLGKKAIINQLPLPDGDVNTTFADISKAKNELGYKPVQIFETGIKEFIKWYNSIKYLSTKIT